MLTRLFRSTQPAALVVLGLAALIMCWFSYVYHFRIVPTNNTPFYNLVLKLYVGLPVYVYFITVVILIISQALHFNWILNKHEVLYKASWMPAFIYLIIATILPPFFWFHPLIFANSLILFVLDKLFYLYKNEHPLGFEFDSAFLLAMASLFYFPLISFLIFYFVSILLLRPFSWRDWTVGLLGFGVPFFFAFVYYFWNNMLGSFYERIFISGIKKNIELQSVFLHGYTFTLALLAIVSTLSIVRLRANFYKNVSKTRLNQQVILFYFLCAMFSILVSREELLYRFCILALPLSIFVTYYLLSGKKILWAEIVFLLLIGSWVVNYSG